MLREEEKKEIHIVFSDLNFSNPKDERLLDIANDMIDLMVEQGMNDDDWPGLAFLSTQS